MKRELVTDPLAFEPGDQIEGTCWLTGEAYRATLLYRGECTHTNCQRTNIWRFASKITTGGWERCGVSDASIRAGRVYRIRRPPEGLTVVRRKELVR